jgi:hypothetical protein
MVGFVPLTEGFAIALQRIRSTMNYRNKRMSAVVILEMKYNGLTV